MDWDANWDLHSLLLSPFYYNNHNEEKRSTASIFLQNSASILILAILLGASPLHSGTWLLAIYVALLLFICAKFIRPQSFSHQLVLIGCWAGAVVIPLDWDRPFQIWPWPCVYGATAGFTLTIFVEIFSLPFPCFLLPDSAGDDSKLKQRNHALTTSTTLADHHRYSLRKRQG